MGHLSKWNLPEQELGD